MERKDKRTRNWTTIVYPDSCPDHWTDKLAELCAPAIISPLHDRDINPDGTPKKPHWHVIIAFYAIKSYSQVADMVKTFGGINPQPCTTLVGTARYLIHKDNPEKAQYDPKDVICLCGADYQNLLLTPTDIRQALRDIVSFMRDNNIQYYDDLLNYCLDHKLEWFDIAAKNTLTLRSYCVSKATKDKAIKEQDYVRRIDSISNRSTQSNPSKLSL